MSAAERAAAIVVMGVSGCGKSTVAAALAERLGGLYADADSLHSEEALAKMAAGTPLTDHDRAPWLRRVAQLIERETRGRTPAVVACSALRRRYRDVLRTHSGGDVFFVHLSGSVGVLSQRMAARTGHFMPPALLESQLNTLEPLETDEAGVVVDIDDTVDNVVARAFAAVVDHFGGRG